MPIFPLVNWSKSTSEEDDLRHEDLPDLQGGNMDGHYHFTKYEHDTLLGLLGKGDD